LASAKLPSFGRYSYVTLTPPNHHTFLSSFCAFLFLKCYLAFDPDWLPELRFVSNKLLWILRFLSDLVSLFDTAIEPVSPVAISQSLSQSLVNLQGAVTGLDDMRVSHLLYANDLTLCANNPGAMQTMLNRLAAYAQQKHLVVNTAKSEVVHFYSRCGASVPILTIGETALAHKDIFKYLGMS